MIGEFIKTDGESLIHVMIPRATADESELLYKSISGAIITKLHTFLAQHIENEGILKQVHACAAIEELEQLKVNLIYPSLFSDIVDELNALEEINDSERTYLLATIADRMILGAQDWMRGNCHQRADAIARAGKGGKIIGLDGKKAKPGKIIT